MDIVDIGKLEQLLQTNWTEFINASQLMRLILEHVRNTNFKILQEQNKNSRCVKLTISKILIQNTEDTLLELWVEFTVPKSKDIVIGTVILHANKTGSWWIKESYGTQFESKNAT